MSVLIGNKETFRQQLQNGTHEDLQQNSTTSVVSWAANAIQALWLKLIYNGYKIFNSSGDTCDNYNVFNYFKHCFKFLYDLINVADPLNTFYCIINDNTKYSFFEFTEIITHKIIRITQITKGVFITKYVVSTSINVGVTAKTTVNNYNVQSNFSVFIGTEIGRKQSMPR